MPKIIRPKKIIDQVDINLLDRDIHMLRNENCKLLDQRDFEIFFTTADLIPNLLREIGRLREISFREIGEGTDQEIDLDRYAKFYRHLILLDNFQKKSQEPIGLVLVEKSSQPMELTDSISPAYSILMVQ